MRGSPIRAWNGWQAEFGKFTIDYTDRWSKVIWEAGIKAE
jgi:hypothetical protein